MKSEFSARIAAKKDNEVISKCLYFPAFISADGTDSGTAMLRVDIKYVEIFLTRFPEFRGEYVYGEGEVFYFEIEEPEEFEAKYAAGLRFHPEVKMLLRQWHFAQQHPEYQVNNEKTDKMKQMVGKEVSVTFWPRDSELLFLGDHDNDKIILKRGKAFDASVFDKMLNSTNDETPLIGSGEISSEPDPLEGKFADNIAACVALFGHAIFTEKQKETLNRLSDILHSRQNQR